MIDLMRDVQALVTGMLQFPIDIPFTPYRKALQARARLNTFLDGLINERRALLGAKGERHKDALDEFIMHKDDKVGTISNQQVEDNLIALLLGGHDTTALALLWLIKYLHENPQAFREVEAVDETLRLSNIVGMVQVHMSSIHLDESIYPNATKFDPSRFKLWTEDMPGECTR
ncbi:beta-amyrin 11-oxidase [Selaginella moellendorffii]|uniref:beta-amyrin 11-oxidase n=1 Tax=Selaginella moellendorffii TaxID=88036 RepID=UPI000D1CECE5|nr:beta-amyrin 11-oxidase [Selaginella moellendorffii]|eukprot:XP_024541594.1 beta-amyrin 11-oxidase [Selaginella moellendorffii]